MRSASNPFKRHERIWLRTRLMRFENSLENEINEDDTTGPEVNRRPEEDGFTT